jgi:hypothetical protein
MLLGLRIALTDVREAGQIRSEIGSSCTRGTESRHPGPQRGTSEAGDRRVIRIARRWGEFTGGTGECVSLERFGASASCQALYQECGLTRERVAAAARSSIARTTGPEGRRTP